MANQNLVKSKTQFKQTELHSLSFLQLNIHSKTKLRNLLYLLIKKIMVLK